jgi:hypothetical protein
LWVLLSAVENGRQVSDCHQAVASLADQRGIMVRALLVFSSLVAVGEPEISEISRGSLLASGSDGEKKAGFRLEQVHELVAVNFCEFDHGAVDGAVELHKFDGVRVVPVQGDSDVIRPTGGIGKAERHSSESATVF